MDALIGAHDLDDWAERRDHALLLILYNTGARISEMTALERSQVCFGRKSFVQFTGKGRKERVVPLWTSTARTLQSWFKEVELDKCNVHSPFPAHAAKMLSRDVSITYCRSA